MDLTALLEKNKSRLKNTKGGGVRKPADIAMEDRPYSSSQIANQSKPSIRKVDSTIEPTTTNFIEAVSDKLTIKQQKTSNKPDTNLTQTQHKVDTNLTQKLDTKSTQTKHKKNVLDTNLTQTKHKPNTKLNTQKTQSKHKVDTNLTQTTHISALIGVQRAILLFIYEECKKARSHVTEPLSIFHISSGLQIPVGSIKTSIVRLCEKMFLTIKISKDGRGGWSIYEIPDKVYKELLQMETRHKLHTNLTQTQHKVDTQPNTQPNTSLSSSSILNIKETTTELSDEWNFDIAPYAKFGFTVSQIKQLASLGIISATDVEQSLIEFSFDFENNFLPAIKGNRLNFLMGILRKGVVYTSETYLNEQQAMISEMARRSSAKKESALKASFEVWETSLTDEERKKVLDKLPTSLMVLEKTYGINNEEVRKWYFDYFAKKYPNK